MTYQEYLAQKNQIQEELSELRNKLVTLEKYYHYFQEKDGKKEGQSIFQIALSDLSASRPSDPGRTEKVRRFIHSSTDWFRNHDVLNYININFPNHGLGTTRISTILAHLCKMGELERMESQNRREGHTYRLKSRVQKEEEFEL